MKKRAVLIFLSVIILISIGLAIYGSLYNPGPKNIILFIGDGMGVSQVTAAKTVNGSLHMERFPVGGFLTTWSSDNYVTDSAAGATALASGVKTNNGSICISPDGDTLKTMLEYARDYGKLTGLVGTCKITHATPAGFASHVLRRNSYPEIALQMARSGVDLMFGGGMKDFKSEYQDSLAYAILAEQYTIITDSIGFSNNSSTLPVAGIFYKGHPPEASKRHPSLASLTQRAITLLSSSNKGFFLMVEGSQIDWMGHSNSSEGMISETIDFDQAVGIGLEFALKNKNTLVLVTADHETGGYSLLDGSYQDSLVTASAFSTEGHSAAMVPLFAFGPGSEVFGGIHDNTFIGRKLIEFITGKKFNR